MKVLPTSHPEVLILEPTVYRDGRGSFMESFNQQLFANHLGFSPVFVQDNQSHSTRGVLRGLHYQLGAPQGKLVRVVRGAVFDVAVDIRPHSSRFGHCVGVELSAENHRQLWIPEGFAHGFLVLGEEALFLYKTTNYYSPKDERCIIWNDPDLAIAWPHIDGPLLISDKDAKGQSFRNADIA